MSGLNRSLKYADGQRVRAGDIITFGNTVDHVYVIVRATHEEALNAPWRAIFVDSEKNMWLCDSALDFSGSNFKRVGNIHDKI